MSGGAGGGREERAQLVGWRAGPDLTCRVMAQPERVGDDRFERPRSSEESAPPVVTQQEPPSAATTLRPKNASKPERWNEIVDAAGHVFEEKGYQAARIEDIAARVGLLKGSLYYYIDSKEDLLFALTDSGHARGLKTIDEDDETSAADPPTRLGAFILRWMGIMPSNPSYSSVAERDVRLLSDERRPQ